MKKLKQFAKRKEGLTEEERAMEIEIRNAKDKEKYKDENRKIARQYKK